MTTVNSGLLFFPKLKFSFSRYNDLIYTFNVCIHRTIQKNDALSYAY
jgi:hypothetical protein